MIALVLTFVCHLPPAGPTSRGDEPPTTTRPASQPARLHTEDREIEALIARLGSARFAERQEAHRRLAALGERAVPLLIVQITSPNPEVASRAAELAGEPADPVLRARVAAALIATTDPDWMERGVHMLFRSPVQVCDEFAARASSAPARAAPAFAVIASMLKEARQRWEHFQPRYERLLKEKPDAADRERQLQEGTNLYNAEAAYWTALEALEDAPPPEPASRPGKP
jgi:hypothetical protein